MEAIKGLRFLASLPLAGTGRTEGDEKMQPFNSFHSRLFTFEFWNSKAAFQFYYNPLGFSGTGQSLT